MPLENPSAHAESVAGRHAVQALSEYEIAVAEYRFNVDLSWKRIGFFVWLPWVRWATQMIAVELSSRPALLSTLARAFNNLCGIGFSVVGIILLLRSHDYYRSSRAQVKQIENGLQALGRAFPFAPLGTTDTMRGVRLRGVRIYRVLLWLFACYIAADAVLIGLWFWAMYGC